MVATVVDKIEQQGAEPHPHFVPPDFRLPQMRFDIGAFNRSDETTQKQAKELLGELEEMKRRNPLAFYEAAGWQHHRFHLASRPRSIRALFGGNRAGKTTTGVGDHLIQMTPPELVPPHLVPYKRHNCEQDGAFKLRVVVPDMVRTGDPIKEKFQDWTPRELLSRGSWDRSWSKAESRLTLECGCFMELLSTEMELNKHGGSARHRVHFDEEPPELYFTENMMRLADYGGDALFTMTPLQGLSWVYREVWKKRALSHLSAFTVGMRNNKHLTQEDVDFVLSLVTNDAERRQREFGEFADRGGPIYPNFMDALRPHPEREFLKGKEIVCAIDPGLNFAGIVWIAFDRDNRAFVFASVKIQRGDVDEYVRRIRQVNQAWGLQNPTYVIDPASSQGNLVDGQSVMDALTMRGIFCIPANNAVEAGVGEVRRRINQGALLVSNILTTIQDEAIEYAAEEREDGVFKPVKKNDHLLDAMRYGLMFRPWLPPPKHQAMTAEGVGQENVAYRPPRKDPIASILGAMA